MSQQLSFTFFEACKAIRMQLAENDLARKLVGWADFSSGIEKAEAQLSLAEEEIKDLRSELEAHKLSLGDLWPKLGAQEEEIKKLRAGGWISVESAPKDGTRILIGWYAETWEQRAGYWKAEHDYVYDAEKDSGYWRGCWTDDAVASFGYEEIFEYAPTHWQPLPNPPSDRGETAKEKDA